VRISGAELKMAQALNWTAIVLLGILTSACSGIDTINGVRMNVSAAPDATYCEKNPTVCVVGAVAIIGGAIALVTSGDRDNAAPGGGGGGGT
jgi:hypothetical protein